MMNYIRRKTRR